MENKKGAQISVLMFPWLAHGHISPFLELAKKLATRNFYIYFCSTPVNLESIKKKLSVENMDSIQLIELHLPSSPDLPPHYHTTNGLPPHLMNALKQALHASAPNFSKILETLKPDIVIYDFVQSWAPALASSYNIPAIQFMTVSASCDSYFLHLIKGDDESKFPFPEISMSEFYTSKLATEVGKEEHAKEAMRRSCKIQLVRTFREIERKYLEHLNANWGKRVIPVGPLVKYLLKVIFYELPSIRSAVSEYLPSSPAFLPSPIRCVGHGCARMTWIFIVNQHSHIAMPSSFHQN